jgi:hypothetical protein
MIQEVKYTGQVLFFVAYKLLFLHFKLDFLPTGYLFMGLIGNMLRDFCKTLRREKLTCTARSNPFPINFFKENKIWNNTIKNM